MVFKAPTKEKKLPIEELQEKHLAGPADEAIDVVA